MAIRLTLVDTELLQLSYQELLEQNGPQQCAVSSEADFPDLRLSLKVTPSSGSSKQCLAQILQTVLGESVTETAFNSAVQRAIAPFAPISLDSGDFRGRSLSSTRLRAIGEQALKQLYAHDPTLQPLLTIYDHLTSEGSDFAAFLGWLERQRASKKPGFYPIFDQGALRDWDGRISDPSARPVPQRPDIGDSSEIHVRASSLRGRSFVLVHCKQLHDSCLQRIAHAFCFKAAEEIGAPAQFGQSNSRATLQCRVISVFGVSDWMIAESDDAAMVRGLKEELASGQLELFALSASSIEYVVLVSAT